MMLAPVWPGTRICRHQAWILREERLGMGNFKELRKRIDRGEC